VKMRAATLHHAGVVGELTALLAAVSFATELVLGCSPRETSQVEGMNVLITKLQGLEELCSQLEGPCVRICSLLLRPPPGQVHCADRLEEAAERLEAALAEHVRRTPSWRPSGHLLHLFGI
jgi:hypothetical protein